MKKLLLTLLLFSSLLNAQNNTDILGRVLDENEKPIAGAKIKINELSQEASSDENGFFKFENITPKTYNISAAASGFEEDTKFNIIIKSAGNSDLIFNLKAFSNKLEILSQIEKGEELTITDPNMTRFLMSLEEAVELVLFAFEHGNSGDLFVNKAPAGTIGDLAQALKELCNAGNEIKIIGTRHGEKLYETLCTREEMVKAEDMGKFFRIPADNRDLNYARYFSEGEKNISIIEDYHSHNTEQLGVKGMKELLVKLPLIRKAVFGEDVAQIKG
jgi:hypothetical protein